MRHTTALVTIVVTVSIAGHAPVPRLTAPSHG